MPERAYRKVTVYSDEFLECLLHKTSLEAVIRMITHGQTGICPGDSDGRMIYPSPSAGDSELYVSGELHRAVSDQ